MEPKQPGTLTWLIQRGFALLAALALTLATFLVLPLMQTIAQRDASDLAVRPIDTALLAPPPPPPPEPEVEEEKPPPPPPKLEHEAPPLDLAQLELVLNPAVGDRVFGDFALTLGQQIALETDEQNLGEIFTLADLDQQPRAIYQPPPTYPPELRKAGRAGTVYVVFKVDQTGRVLEPKVQRSSDPGFENAALDAVRRWKFEPGTRKGQKVQFKLRVPITFNAG